MLDISSDPHNRVAKFLFVAFNLLALVTIVAGVLEFVLVFQSVELKTLSGELRFIVLGAVGWWNVFLAGICLTLAQILRFLVTSAGQFPRNAD